MKNAIELSKFMKDNAGLLVDEVVTRLEERTQLLVKPIPDCTLEGKLVGFRTLPYLYYIFGVADKATARECLNLCNSMPDTVKLGGKNHTVRCVIVASYEDRYVQTHGKVELMGIEHINSLSAFNYFEKLAVSPVRKEEPKLTDGNLELIADICNLLRENSQLSLEDICHKLDRNGGYKSTVKRVAEQCGDIMIQRASLLNSGVRLSLVEDKDRLRTLLRGDLDSVGLFRNDVIEYLVDTYTGVAKFDETDIEMLDAIFNKGCLCANEAWDAGYSESLCSKLQKFVESHNFEFDNVCKLLESGGVNTVMLYVYKLVKQYGPVKSVDIGELLGIHSSSMRGYYGALVRLKAIRVVKLEGVNTLVAIDYDLDNLPDKYENPLVDVEAPAFVDVRCTTRDYTSVSVHNSEDLPTAVIEKLLKEGYVEVGEVICRKKLSAYMAYKQGLTRQGSVESSVIDLLQNVSMNSKEIGTKLGIATKSISTTLSRLVKEGLLEKLETKEEGKRTKKISYTGISLD